MPKPFIVVFSLIVFSLALFLITFGGFVAFAILLLASFVFAFVCQEDAETTFYSLYAYLLLFLPAASLYVIIRDCVHPQDPFATILITAILFPSLFLLGAILLTLYGRKHFPPQSPDLTGVLSVPMLLLLSTVACAIVAASCLAKLFPDLSYLLD